MLSFFKDVKCIFTGGVSTAMDSKEVKAHMPSSVGLETCNFYICSGDVN